MSYKIAVASSDGKVVNVHFGQAEQFYIIEVADNDSYKVVEKRNANAACGQEGHSEKGLLASAQLLADCKYVLVSRIGPGAERVLAQENVTAFSIGLIIENAVEKLIRYENNKK